MARMKALNSWAMATTTCLACVPLASSWRYRLQSRTGAFQLIFRFSGLAQSATGVVS